MRNAYTILVVKPEKKILFERPWHRWEDNVTIYLKGIEIGVVDWTHLALVNTEM
jgi:hypothetical protein